jgi:hypothetical protein
MASLWKEGRMRRVARNGGCGLRTCAGFENGKQRTACRRVERVGTAASLEAGDDLVGAARGVGSGYGGCCAQCHGGPHVAF